jgi:ribosome-binding protein aMBF1 (putative translation factor)
MARKKKGEQLVVPGSDTDRHKDIDTQAEVLRDAQESLKAATKQRDLAKEELGERMKKHGLKRYSLADSDPPREVVVAVKHDEVKIRLVKPAKGDDSLDD